jgi:hypothetical protein
MMMAHASDTPPPALHADTVAAVRDALSRYVRQGDHTPELRALLARVAEEARSRGILAERLLLQFKEIWGSLPEVRAVTDHAAANRQGVLLQQLVTRCIEEYYAV